MKNGRNVLPMTTPLSSQTGYRDVIIIIVLPAAAFRLPIISERGLDVRLSHVPERGGNVRQFGQQNARAQTLEEINGKRIYCSAASVLATPCRTISAAAALVLFSSIVVCQGQMQLESCQDLMDAFELTKTQVGFGLRLDSGCLDSNPGLSANTMFLETRRRVEAWAFPLLFPLKLMTIIS